jgi:ABC-type multidrug transport system permease subunit
MPVVWWLTQNVVYEFLYTSIGQAIAAYSPNAFFAALANPIILGAALINFCGVVVPYEQIQAFWRYWLYWLDPFTYLVQGLLTPVTWYQQVQCKPDELTYIPLPSNTTCGGFLEDFMANHAGYVTDPGNTTTCAYCEYSTGADYLKTLNIKGAYYGWRSVRFPILQIGSLELILTIIDRHHSTILCQLVLACLFDDEAKNEKH